MPDREDTTLELFASFVTEAQALLAVDNVCVHLLSYDKTRLVCQAVSSGFRASRLAQGLDITASPGAQAAIAERTSVRVDDATTDPRVAQVARERYGLRACAYVPLVVEGEAVGVAVFSFQHPHVWTDAEVQAAEALVGQLQRKLRTPSQRSEALAGPPLDQLLDTIPAQLWVLDGAFFTRWANDGTGSAAAAPIGSPERRISVDALLGAPEGGPELMQGIQAILAGKQRRHVAVVSAYDAFWHVTAASTSRGDGPQDSVALAVMDVTESMLALRSIEAARNINALGRLSANVAHEMNNLLQLVLALVEDIQQKPDAVALARFSENVSRTVQRGVSLTRQLLSFAAPDHSPLESFDLTAALTAWWPLLRQSVGPNRKPRLISSDEACITAPKREIELAIINVLVNARDASSQGSPITVSIDDAGDFVRLDIVDVGEGMPPEVLARATEPFFTTKRATEGTGLGLASVRRMLESCGGRLVLASALGRGTTVSMYFPRQRAEPVRPDGSASAVGAEAHRVLYLEDDPSLGAAMNNHLRLRGMVVRRFSSVADALTAWRAEPTWPTALLTDLALEDGSGLEVAAVVARERPDVRVVIYSGHVSAGDLEVIEQHAWTLLEKPVQVSLILAALGEKPQAKH